MKEDEMSETCHVWVRNTLETSIQGRRISLLSSIYKILIQYFSPVVNSIHRQNWEEHRLRVFENTVLGKMLGPKREEVAGGWRRLYNVELCNLLG
jgi:hypothetical protein